MPLNEQALNEEALNTESFPVSATLDKISFNNYGLQNASIIVSEENFGFRNMASRDISLFDAPQTNGEILNSVFFRGRTIVVEGALVSDSKENLDDLIDDFKLNLAPANKLLKWRVNGEIRQILATVQNITFGVKDNVFISYTLTFRSQESFWSNETQQSLTVPNFSVSPRTEQIPNSGQTSEPIFICGFGGALSGVTSFSITAGGIGITINQSISSNDIVVIDGVEKVVKINNTEVDFDGIFPQFETGTNTTVFTINGTFTVDILVVYKLNLL